MRTEASPTTCLVPWRTTGVFQHRARPPSETAVESAPPQSVDAAVGDSNEFAREALSVDMILTNGGPMIIDINPRLVEPTNALRSGVDLLGALMDVAIHNRPIMQAERCADTKTHQLLAILGAAQAVWGDEESCANSSAPSPTEPTTQTASRSSRLHD